MLEPKLPLRRSHVTRCAGLLVITSALATSTSPAAASALHRAESMPIPAARPAKSREDPGPLRVEVEPTIDDAKLLSGWIVERNLAVAKEIPLVQRHDQWVAVKIGGATYDYRVSVTPMRDGAPLDAMKDPEVCECNSEALLALLDERIAAAAAELRARPPRASERGRIQDPFWGTTTDDDRRRRKPRSMGYAGIGVAVLGGGLLGSGLSLAFRRDEIRGEIGEIDTRSTHDTGIGLAVAGGATLVAGISLLAVDLVRQRKRRLAVAPTWGPRHAGLVLSWKLRGRGMQ